MAVRAPARGRGIGAGVLRALETVAVDRGCESVELHAQLHAAPFYERLGYKAVGSIYLEADIQHVSMRKDLPQA